mmetsp:Transcript_5354/g.9342  ORF Transcript_5354/g.9342 Transcript_5354/m.9342 type:complete len:243 (+) Transcript_5354:87-815(+)
MEGGGDLRQTEAVEEEGAAGPKVEGSQRFAVKAAAAVGGLAGLAALILCSTVIASRPTSKTMQPQLRRTTDMYYGYYADYDPHYTDYANYYTNSHGVDVYACTLPPMLQQVVASMRGDFKATSWSADAKETYSVKLWFVLQLSGSHLQSHHAIDAESGIVKVLSAMVPKLSDYLQQYHEEQKSQIIREVVNQLFDGREPAEEGSARPCDVVHYDYYLGYYEDTYDTYIAYYGDAYYSGHPPP